VPFGRDQILVATENNGTRIYGFAAEGVLDPKPLATNMDPMPDSLTPVISGDHVFGIWNELYALNRDSLKTTFSSDDDAFATYGSLIASDTRLLCLSAFGELLLLSTDTPTPRIQSRLQLIAPGTDILSHPAVAGNALYTRLGREIVKIDLNAPQTSRVP
jgi:outer membrane protein assembly factor BamB